MTILYRNFLVSLASLLMITACSGNGSGTIASGGNGPETTEEDVVGPQSVSPQSDSNLLSEAGNNVSQSELSNSLDSITTGSGEVLVNLGEVVTALGDGLPLGSTALEIDDAYVSRTLQGTANATEKLGTTVVSAGDTVAQLDALPVFVQLNDRTGLLTYTGVTVSDLGGTVENIGGWLQYQTSEEGNLYGLSEQLGTMTAPILVQADGMIDLKGNALVIFNDVQDVKTTLPNFVYLSTSTLTKGTTALLMDTQGMVEDTGQLFVGEKGLTALLTSELQQDETLLLNLESALTNRLDTDPLSGLNDNNLLSETALLSSVDGNLILVSQNLGDVLNLETGLVNSLDLSTTLLNFNQLDDASTPLSSLLGSTAQSLQDVVGGLKGNSLDVLSLDITDNLAGEDKLGLSSSSEDRGTLTHLTTSTLKPILGQ
ncbi:collagen-like triple helix repeat-containing protein [Vibrio kanaloae]|uniref:collagen-like triple helix repeat-containing protein n=1 Tax=Vibrio kanaloae TaxID=170673 RepID=UPI001EFD7C0B|nr:collagen-like triple helix repeat-containing protein [Vibrio kanaloae]MCG9559675.1 collagen-like triple helix repeat-containing protein [Vibrio kanaloae]